jgi:hypothetical protein
MQGSAAGRAEHDLEVRDVDAPEVAARIWTGPHVALDFHGHITTTSFVAT